MNNKKKLPILILVLAILSCISLAHPKHNENQTATLKQRVSVKLEKATFEQAFKWLKDKGIEYVVREDIAKTKGTVWVNLKNRPLDETISLIAKAFGLSWRTEGGVLVFYKPEVSEKDGVN